MTLAREFASERDRIPQIKKSYSRIPEVIQVPNLITIQLDSYEWFKREALRELFDEVSPILDFTGNRLELRFGDYSFHEPKYCQAECRERDMTYAAPLHVNVELLVKETGEIKETEIFMGDFPLMTENGTFIINGAERVVVSPAGAFARCVLHPDERRHQRPRPLLRQAHPQPRRLAGVRDKRQERGLRQGRPQEEDPHHHPPAGHR